MPIPTTSDTFLQSPLVSDHLTDILDQSRVHFPCVKTQINNTVDKYLPDVILYRRTKKSGSTAMVKTLREKLEAFGYIDVSLVNPSMQLVARAAAINTSPQRYLFSSHNNLVRSDFRGKRVVIIDTIRDGYNN